MRIVTPILMCILLILAVAVWGQPEAAYKLAPDDVISVKVLNLPQFSDDFLIPADGAIQLFSVGRIMAGGHTLKELTDLITTQLSQRLRRPEVVVTLKTPRAHSVYVIGAVAHPGIYEIKPGWHITEALTAAGGFLLPAQDTQVTLLRAATGTSVRLNAPEILAAKDTANLVLKPDDVCNVEGIDLLPIYVTGDAVKTPGLKDLRAGGGVPEALALAGGLAQPTDEVTVTITRAGTVTKATLHSAAPLQRGDVLAVDSMRTMRVLVLGKVKTPGYYILKPTEGPAEALTLAGGPLTELVDVIVILTHDGKQRTMPVTTCQSGGEASKIPLAVGDIIDVETLRTVRVMVAGKVTHPGICELKPQEGLVEALTLAGGPLPEAALGKISITRAAGRVETCDLSTTFLDTHSPHNVPLNDGDLVVVPESTQTFAVLGFVQQPGTFPLPQGKRVRLSDAIGFAKGVDNTRGSIGQVAILRTDGTGTQKRMVVDLASYVKWGKALGNPDIQTGDLIYVPKTANPDWSLIFGSLSNAAIVYNVVK